MRRATLIAALSVGSLFNLFDLDQDAAIVLVTDGTDADDDIIREELARRHGFDKQYRKAIARLLIRPGIRDGQGLVVHEIHVLADGSIARNRAWRMLAPSWSRNGRPALC